MAYVEVTGRPVGERFERDEQMTANTTVKRAYRPFVVERFEYAGVSKIDDEELKKELEGSCILVHPENNVPGLTPGEEFALMHGIKDGAGNFPELVLRGELYEYRDNTYKMLRVKGVRIVERQKQKPEPTVAPIDYDESIELGKKEKEAEYTGNGAGFEL